VLESVFRAPQLAQMTLHAKADYARPELSARMLLLPLSSDLGDVTRALGCIIAEGQIGVAPRRFDLTHDEVMPILEGGKTLTPSPSGFEPDRRTGGRDGTPLRPLATAEPAAKRPDTPESRRAGFRVISLQQASLPTGKAKT